MRKLKSIKNVVAFFSMAAIAYILLFEKTAFLPLAEKMALILVAYAPCNVWQKKIMGEGRTCDAAGIVDGIRVE